MALQVADALSYAHGQGVLHRDVKPSNLILDAKGTIWVTDFGLAKAEGSDNLTQSGDAVGTLAYMAPERFAGWSDPRSDVYGIGLTLYELLTLSPAHHDVDANRLIKKVSEGDPLRPGKVDHRIPRDLETIVLKAIAKDPGQRYASAEDMADDLRRFATGKPVRARRSGVVERTWKWSKRRPAAAALIAVSVLALATTSVGTWLHNVELSTALDEAEWRRLISESRASLHTDPSFARCLAFEANRRRPGRVTNETLLATMDASRELHRLFVTGREWWILHGRRQLLVLESHDMFGLWDLVSGHRLRGICVAPWSLRQPEVSFGSWYGYRASRVGALSPNERHFALRLCGREQRGVLHPGSRRRG